MVRDEEGTNKMDTELYMCIPTSDFVACSGSGPSKFVLK